MRTSKLQAGGELVVYCERDIRGIPISDYNHVGLIDIIDSQKEFVLPVHYSGNCLVHPLKRLSQESTQNVLQIAEDIAQDIHNPRLNCAKLTRFKNSYPLVLFGLNEQGDYYSRFSVLFFGKEFNPESKVPLNIEYNGVPVLYTYEQVIEMNKDISGPVCQEFERIQLYLEVVRYSKSQCRARNRNKKRRA
jgi:hypothetical protein